MIDVEQLQPGTLVMYNELEFEVCDPPEASIPLCHQGLELVCGRRTGDHVYYRYFFLNELRLKETQ